MFKNSKFKIINLGLIVFVGVGMLFVNQAYASVIPKPPNNLGLVGYWSLEDGVGNKTTDFSGNGNVGTLTNFALSTTTGNWVNGRVGKALALDGNDDYVNLGSGSSLQGTGSHSLCAWFLTNSSNYAFIVTKSSDLNSGGWGFAIAASSTNAGAHFVYTDDGTVQVNGGKVAIAANRWHHICAVFTSGSSLKTYVDGVLGDTTNTTHTTLRVGAASLIGWSGNIDPNFSGSIDDVRIYNRALSVADVTALYTTSARRLKIVNNTNVGLIGYWPFSEGTGTTTADVYGQNNNGTLTSTANPATTSSGWNAGKFGNGINFDGINDYVNLALDNLAPGSGSWSISAWTNSFGSTGDTQYIYFDATDTVNNRPLVTFGYSITPNLTTTIRDASGNQVTRTATALSYNAWYHLVATYNQGTHTLTQYVNGSSVGTNTNASVGAINTGTLSVPVIGTGKDGGSLGQYFNGSIDDVRVYKRALSAQEVSQLYGQTSTAYRTKINSSQNTKSTNGLVGLWSFNGQDLTTTTSTDRSGQGNNGTLTSGPIPTIGKIGQALQFDGVDDNVLISATNILGTGSPTYSLCNWFNANTINPANTYAGFIGVNLFNNTRNGVVSGIKTGGVAYVDTFNTEWNPYSSFSANQWYHVCLTSDGSNQYYYVNGVFQTSRAETSSFSAGTTILGYAKVLSRYFDGKIDDVRIYNRALSAQEVLDLYNQGK